eukprot:1160745-Pelagomonas_calceolata.AAC.10
MTFVSQPSSRATLERNCTKTLARHGPCVESDSRYACNIVIRIPRRSCAMTLAKHGPCIGPC